ncbi:Lrp/AsnC family transcriptional regulator [Amorphus coralli]|uniref:Lrp/AsnC family transcriptional regulator n=1 Tax=Amorphus coralli TaxID=340680 RepID=UPI0003708AD5|nr:Lrp/AsnC family transcriptional regulator [Amorphus coralli]
MDRIDRTLLTLLQRDASRTNAALADEVGLSPSSCLRRIRRLRASGIINRVVAILNPSRAGRSLRTIVTVELKEHGEQQMRRFLTLAAQEEAVTQAFAVTGSVDVVLVMRLADMEEFDALCERLFRERTNVVRFSTLVVIRTAKDETAIPLEGTISGPAHRARTR